MDKKTKNELVKKAVNGDTESFSMLYAEIYKQLYYYALTNLGNSEDAADAVHDAVLDAYSSLSVLKNSQAFDSWMFKILVAKIKRKQKEYAESREKRSDTDEIDCVIKTSSAFERCEIIEEFANLSEPERLCMTLSCIAGYKGEEVAEITGIKHSTIRSHISRGRAKIKQRLNLKGR